MNDKHENKKRGFKVVGICMIIIGLIFEIIGFISIFNFPRTNLWILIIVGFILMFCSIGVISIGFSREFTKYRKNAVMPIINELKQEIIQPNTKCNNCGAINEGDGKFCKECGKPLYKICPHCNARLNDESKYCPQCGKAIEEQKV